MTEHSLSTSSPSGLLPPANFSQQTQTASFRIRSRASRQVVAGFMPAYGNTYRGYPVRVPTTLIGTESNRLPEQAQRNGYKREEAQDHGNPPQEYQQPQLLMRPRIFYSLQRSSQPPYGSPRLNRFRQMRMALLHVRLYSSLLKRTRKKRGKPDPPYNDQHSRSRNVYEWLHNCGGCGSGSGPIRSRFGIRPPISPPPLKPGNQAKVVDM